MRYGSILHLYQLQRPGLRPVSYTHLDVYKRQGLISAALAVPALRLLPGAAEAGLVYGRPVQSQVWPEFGTVLLLSAAGAAALLGLLLRLSVEGQGKKGGNSIRRRL